VKFPRNIKFTGNLQP